MQGGDLSPHHIPLSHFPAFIRLFFRHEYPNMLFLSCHSTCLSNNQHSSSIMILLTTDGFSSAFFFFPFFFFAHFQNTPLSTLPLTLLRSSSLDSFSPLYRLSSSSNKDSGPRTLSSAFAETLSYPSFGSMEVPTVDPTPLGPSLVSVLEMLPRTWPLWTIRLSLACSKPN